MPKTEYNPRKRETELRVSQVPKETRRQLKAIAKNIGIDFAVFMKQEFRKIIDSYPEKMRIPPSNF